MSKMKKLFIALSILSAVGITYLVTTLKDFPDVFDLEGDDEDF